MNGLTRSYMFKESLPKCEPIDLSRFEWTSGRGTWIIGHFILIRIHDSATENAPLIINVALSLQRGPWSHICHTPFPLTCFLTFLVTLFAAWQASDFMLILYELKQ